MAKNDRKAFSGRSMEKIYLKDTRNIYRKLKQLRKRKMIKTTSIKMGKKAMKSFNIKFKNKKPKINTKVTFYHIRQIHEVESFIY